VGRGEEAAEALAGVGLSVSDAVRMLLVRVAAEKALPFAVDAMRATDEGKGKRHGSAEVVSEDLGDLGHLRRFGGPLPDGRGSVPSNRWSMALGRALPTFRAAIRGARFR